MSKKILCIGDNYTFGGNLSDPKLDAWPNLIAKRYSCEVVNKGNNSLTSMERCIRILFEEINNNYDLIIFGCPSWKPQEFYSLVVDHPIAIGPHILTSKTPSAAPWATGFFKYSYNNSYYFRKWLTNIILVQSFLKQTNQKYIMFFSIRSMIVPYNGECDDLLEKIDKTSFIDYPKNLAELVQHTYKESKNLPGEQDGMTREGHLVVADLIQTQIDHQKLI